jgi:hypothetical protein
MLLLLMIWQTYNDSHKCTSIFPANSVAAVNFLQEKRSQSYTLLLVLLGDKPMLLFLKIEATTEEE